MVLVKKRVSPTRAEINRFGSERPKFFPFLDPRVVWRRRAIGVVKTSQRRKCIHEGIRPFFAAACLESLKHLLENCTVIRRPMILNLFDVNLQFIEFFQAILSRQIPRRVEIIERASSYVQKQVETSLIPNRISGARLLSATLGVVALSQPGARSWFAIADSREECVRFSARAGRTFSQVDRIFAQTYMT